MRHFKRGTIGFIGASLAVLLAACGGSGSAGSTNTPSQQSNSAAASQAAGEGTSGSGTASGLKVGLVADVGGLHDHSFNQSADDGLMRAQKELGIQATAVQSQRPEDYVTNLSNLAQQGDQLVIAVGFNMTDAVQQVAPQFPKTHFLLIDSTVNLPNVTSALFKSEQAGYLVGALSGLLETKGGLPHLNGQNVVGVIGGQEIPPVDSYIAGFQQGFKQTDPSGKVLLRYVGNFTDTAAGEQLASLEISQGTDIVFQVAGPVGQGVFNAASQHNAYAIGVDSDESYLAPNVVLTSAIKRVDVAVFDTIKALQDNSLQSGVSTFELKNDGVGMAPPMKGIPQAIVDQVNQLKQQIVAGQITVSPEVQK
ncbi:MAG: BMP family ABC transporter substrate-binding protein [Firmicutes bacterium]|nr:BMP family ABC transporter substrate-binding protein [Bacillota bacterium]